MVDHTKYESHLILPFALEYFMIFYVFPVGFKGNRFLYSDFFVFVFPDQIPHAG